jgi:transcriptional regulator with XRE-family HTH domain
MQTRGEWSADLTRSIAKNVRRYRKAKDWSARELAETCTILGFDIPRTAVSDLENGRRLFITVSELLMLARALEVSPIDLVFPQDREEPVRVSPAELLDSFEAGQWWSGRRKIVGVGHAVRRYVQPKGHDPRSLFQEHESLVMAIRYVCRQLETATIPETVQEAQDVLRTDVNQLTELRQMIRSFGFIPPNLPQDLAFFLGNEPL